MGQAKNRDPWFRGLSKLRHVAQAIVANEIGKWGDPRWAVPAGQMFGKFFEEFRAENPVNFDLWMNPKSGVKP
jgi:hypothetical protein